MKTLTTQQIEALNRLPVRPVTLVKIEFTQPSAFTAYITDRPHYTHNGQEYLGLLLTGGSAEAGNVDPLAFTFTTSSVSLELNNAHALYGFDRFSSMLYHPTKNPTGYVLPYAQCTISVIFEDTDDESPGVSNELVRFVGYCEPPDEITSRRIKFKVSDVLEAYNDRIAILIASNSNLPVIREDDIGKAANIVYGKAKEVTTIQATSGGTAVLLDDIDGSGTIPNGRLRISNCARLDTAGGQFVIGDELFSYGQAVCKEDSGEVGDVLAIFNDSHQLQLVRSLDGSGSQFHTIISSTVISPSFPAVAFDLTNFGTQPEGDPSYYSLSYPAFYISPLQRSLGICHYYASAWYKETFPSGPTGVDVALTVDFVEYEEPPNEAALTGYTAVSPPTIKRVIETVTFGPTVFPTIVSPASIDLTGVRFFGIIGSPTPAETNTSQHISGATFKFI